MNRKITASEQVNFQICPELNEINVRRVKIKGKQTPYIFLFKVERTHSLKDEYILIPVSPQSKDKAQSPSSFIPHILFAEALSKVNEN